jgi:hypothetical protein
MPRKKKARTGSAKSQGVVTDPEILRRVVENPPPAERPKDVCDDWTALEAPG